MLKLTGITKEYKTGGEVVKALKGIDLQFRKSEFVSVLGQSGCGKTTMLNIIGGLDHYTEGDLIINGKSTKDFKDKDWDTYRNHSIGFVFQSYNLIPHQTVLSNVELALTLSGVSKSERKKRAKEALEKVGLADQIHKKPNQMSGGQMQRVAIARALVNNPDIILADEPTGALDSETSVQIMEILKEISKDKLIIMVTHNPELAEEYSSRIIRLLDGQIIGDTNPYDGKEEKKNDDNKKVKHTSMSLFTATSLSFNNLLTKKGRTFLTAFAGSIGIIGIALILSLSHGIQLYIDRTEEDTLSSYPITIQSQLVDMSSMMTAMVGNSESSLEENVKKQEKDKIYSNNIMSSMINGMVSGATENNMDSFKKYLEEKSDELDELSNDVKYMYSTTMNVYSTDLNGELLRVNPSSVLENMGMTGGSGQMQNMQGMQVWQQITSNDEYLNSMYDVVKGRMPEEYNEVVLIVDENNQVSDYALYSLGMMDSTALTDMFKAYNEGTEIKEVEQQSFTFDEIMNKSYKMVANTDYYEKVDGEWIDKSDNKQYLQSIVDNGVEIKVVGILKPAEDSSINVNGVIGYRPELMEYLVNKVNESEIVKEQKANPDVDVFTGIDFEVDTENVEYTMEDLEIYVSTLPEEEKEQVTGYILQMEQQGMAEEDIIATFSEYLTPQTTEATYDGNLYILGVSDINSPSIIEIYPKDFESKEAINDLITEYNDSVENEEDEITYTDYIGIMMSSVTTIINAISYVLIGFVSISLIVSSIMIGIITYISVLERTKEIGILRAVGASKKDVSRVFNAETLLVGFSAGAIGIGVSMLLNIPINMIIYELSEINGVAKLPWQGGVALVIISMVLTFIAGLIPAKVAAKKDPVEALRTE